jgi:prefoldin subunit 5
MSKASVSPDPNHARSDEPVTTAADRAEAIDSLDNLFKEAVKVSKGEPAPEPAPEPNPEPAPEPNPEPNPEPAPEPAPELDIQKKSDDSTKSAPDAKSGQEPPPEPAAPPREPDELDKVQLPPHTKPKSAEAFEEVKRLAREAHNKLRTELEEKAAKLTAAEKQLEELNSKVGKLPENVEAELAELRKFRLAHDVKSDPTFKQLDQQLVEIDNSIMAKLEAVGASKETLDQITKLGGPRAIEWDGQLEKLPSSARLYIQGKLVEAESTVERRDKALTQAQQNAEQFLKGSKEREASELKSYTDRFIAGQPWLQESKVPANATPEQKAAIEANNKFAKDALSKLDGFLNNRSNERFAELAVGTMLAHRFHAELSALEPKVEQLEKTVASLTKERDEARTALEKIKRAEAPRPRGEGGKFVPAGKAPAAVDLEMSGADAIDALYREARAGRE